MLSRWRWGGGGGEVFMKFGTRLPPSEHLFVAAGWFFFFVLRWGCRKGFLLMTFPWLSYLYRCHCVLEPHCFSPESGNSSWRSFTAGQGLCSGFYNVSCRLLWRHSCAYGLPPQFTAYSLVITLATEETQTQNKKINMLSIFISLSLPLWSSVMLIFTKLQIPEDTFAFLSIAHVLKANKSLVVLFKVSKV